MSGNVWIKLFEKCISFKKSCKTNVRNILWIILPFFANFV